MNGELTIHTDGGARGNPGPAACSFIAEYEGKVLERKSKFLGNATNNFAEYQGVLLALSWISEKPNLLSQIHLITFYLDSELVVRQISGLYRVKDEKLKVQYLKVNDFVQNLKTKIFFKNVPRSKNKIADFLVNKELDSAH